MIDETEIKTRHQEKLAELREKHGKGNGRGSASRGSDQDPERGIRATERTGQRSFVQSGTGEGGIESESGTFGRSDPGVRPSNIQGVNTTESTYSDYRKTGIETSLTPEQEEERQRELHRQRQARYAERKKQEKLQEQEQASSSNHQASRHHNMTMTTDAYNDLQAKSDGKDDQGAQFKLKNPFKTDKKTEVKLFTNKEIDEQLERLSTIYSQGSGLLDDLLEIIVKGHEKVQIWQLDDTEAATLASIHLERAKTDEGAARSARALLSLYDRLYIWMLAGPRFVATKNHITESGGLSFK